MKKILIIAIALLFSNTIFAQEKERMDTSIGFLDSNGNETIYIYKHSCVKCRAKYPNKNKRDKTSSNSLAIIKNKENA